MGKRIPFLYTFLVITLSVSCGMLKDNTCSTAIHSDLNGKWIGNYSTKEGKTLEIRVPETNGDLELVIDPNYGNSNYKKLAGTANLVSSSVAEFIDENGGCSLRLFLNTENEIEITNLKGGSTTICDVYTGTYILKK